MTFTDEDVRRTKLVFNRKPELAFDKDTLNHLNACVKISISQDSSICDDMFIFHVHTLGCVEYIYFIHKYVTSARGKIPKSIIQKDLIEYYHNLIQKSR